MFIVQIEKWLHLTNFLFFCSYWHYNLQCLLLFPFVEIYLLLCICVYLMTCNGNWNGKLFEIISLLCSYTYKLHPRPCFSLIFNYCTNSNPTLTFYSHFLCWIYFKFTMLQFHLDIIIIIHIWSVVAFFWHFCVDWCHPWLHSQFSPIFLLSFFCSFVLSF